MIIGILRSRVNGTSGLSIVGQVSLGHTGFFRGHSALVQGSLSLQKSQLEPLQQKSGSMNLFSTSMQLKANLFFQGWAVFGHVVQRMEEAVSQSFRQHEHCQEVGVCPILPYSSLPSRDFFNVFRATMLLSFATNFPSGRSFISMSAFFPLCAHWRLWWWGPALISLYMKFNSLWLFRH